VDSFCEWESVLTCSSKQDLRKISTKWIWFEKFR